MAIQNKNDRIHLKVFIVLRRRAQKIVVTYEIFFQSLTVSFSNFLFFLRDFPFSLSVDNIGFNREIRIILDELGFSDLESRGCHLRPQMALFAFSSLPKRHGLETGGVLSLFQKGG